ncbi:MAG TPA: hypothetical protein VGA37_02130 [Gemmatimonadales bacterium]
MRFLTVIALACAASLGPRTLVAQRRPISLQRLGSLDAAGIHESSGVAVSRRFRGILWTHDDSGGRPRIYAVDTTGMLVATFVVNGARARDWEDIALGRCPDDPTGWCLFIGDIGDNDERRTRVVVYVIREPDPRGARDGDGTVRARAVRVRYADGPHDAEALAVTPEGDVVIITKGRQGTALRYDIGRSALLGDSVTVTLQDTLPIRPRFLLAWVTGGAISPSGARVVIRSYTELHFFRRVGARWEPDGDACTLGLIEPQGEAVDFLDEDRVILTSERSLGRDASIHVVRC